MSRISLQRSRAGSVRHSVFAQLAVAVTTVGCLLGPWEAAAQLGRGEAGPRLEVKGEVVRLYQSDSGKGLVELELQGVSLDPTGGQLADVRVPSPGEVLYIAVERRAGGRLVPDRAQEPLKVGDAIAGRVSSGGRGRWLASGDWFEVVGETDNLDRGTEALGMRVETKRVGGQTGLVVAEVGESGPAQEAGFQRGDIIVAINGKPIGSAADLSAIGQASRAAELAVIDVNSGRVAKVKLSPQGSAGRANPPADMETQADPATRVRSSLGVTFEEARVGLRRAVRVTSVDPVTPAGEAGLEVGDVVAEVDGKRVASVAEVAAALPSRAGPITLTVRDVRSGREVPVPVNARGISAQQPARPKRDAEPANPVGQQGTLGVTGELAFYDAEAAVKVVRVAPRSPAFRAGIRSGMLLVSANGKPLLHPDDLAKVGGEGGKVTLEVVDPESRRRSSVEVR